MHEGFARKQLKKFSGRDRQKETETTTKRAREGKGAGVREVQIFAFLIRGAIMVSCWGCNPSEVECPLAGSKKHQNVYFFELKKTEGIDSSLVSDFWVQNRGVWVCVSV